MKRWISAFLVLALMASMFSLSLAGTAFAADVAEGEISALMLRGYWDVDGAEQQDVHIYSVEDLEEYMEEFHSGKANELFGSDAEKYNEAFFKEKSLYITLVKVTGSSPNIEVASIKESEYFIEVDTTKSDEPTTPDMANWILLLELNPAQAKKVVLVSFNGELVDNVPVPVSIGLVCPYSESEIEAMIAQRLPENPTVDDENRYDREVRKEIYSALTSLFAEKYLNESCNILFRGKYNPTIFAEVPKDQVRSLAMQEEVARFYYAEGLHDEITNGIIISWTDVSRDDWYYESVQYVFHRSLMVGVAGNTFAPGDTVSRAMAATVLYRLAECPAPENAPEFTDVEAEKWYSDGIYWAASEGIAEGYGNNKFGTNDPVTREQLVTIFWRAQGKPDAAQDALSDFSDAAEISAWAEDAFAWAVSTGLIQGKPGAILDPKGTTTRAELAQILMNYDQLKN